MQKKLFITYFVIIIVTLFICSITFWTMGYRFVEDQNLDSYLVQAKILEEVFGQTEFDEEYKYGDFAKEYGNRYKIRITIIGKDGIVVGDSLEIPEIMENHGDREEVIRALSGEASSVKRYSTTLGMNYCYAAVPLIDDDLTGVLRVAVPLERLKQLDVNLMQAIVIALIIASLAATLIAVYFMQHITKPINELTKVAENISNGDYGTKIYTVQTDQLKRLANAFNRMSASLKVNIEKLTNRNNELEAMLCSMESGIVAIDHMDGILFFNDAFTNIAGIGGTDITGRSLYNTARNSVIFEVVDMVREKEESFVKEGKISVKEERIIRVTGTPLHEKQDKTLGVLLIIEDITELRKLENMRSDFVSNVTHELKTPLTSIRGFVDTLKNGAIQDEIVAKKFLDIIDIEAERLYILIQDILLLSEIESKKEDDDRFCDVNQIVLDVVELLSSKTNKETDLIYEPNTELEPYYCNPDRIKQLLINLIDNAIKYTEKGFVKIVCKNEENELLISIEDTGIGMEEEYLPRIFERFYRVDKGRSRKQGGTGLGLSIVKHILERYKGTIFVTSKIGEGTRFLIQLPY